MNAFDEPINLFDKWYNQAQERDKEDVSAFCLSTVSKNNTSSSRMVLLKDYDHKGFVFYTNLESKKSRHILVNPAVSACFYWWHISKQIRIEGQVELVSEKEANKYFSTRSRNSRIGAWASKQSSELKNGMEDLFSSIEKINKKFIDKDVTRPKFWSGYRIKPELIEFWQEGKNRIHERIVYEKTNNKWKLKRLYP